MAWGIGLPTLREVYRSVGEKTAEHVYSSIISGLVAAVLTTLLFFVTSHKTNVEKLKAEMQLDVTNKLRVSSAANTNGSVEFDYINAFKSNLNDDTVVLSGKFDAKGSEQANDKNEDGLFIAVFGEAPKSLIDNLVGRDAGKELQALITFAGAGDSRRLGSVQAEDVFKSGENAIVFDIIQVYADGSAILPVIAYEEAGKWKLALPRNFDGEAEAAFKEASTHKDFRVSAATRQWMAEAKSPERPNLTFLEDWKLSLNGKLYEAAALRNSSGYKYFKHPEFGYKQLLVATSYFDDAVNAAHRVFVKAMKLESSPNGFEWKNDDTWNQGHGIVSAEPLHYDRLNYDQLYDWGINRRDHVTYWGPNFSKERRGQ